MESSASDMKMLAVTDRQPAETINITPVKYIPIDVLKKEEDEVDATNTHKMTENPPPPLKKSRQSATNSNPETVAFEEEALQVNDTENWVGLLQRELVHRIESYL